MVKVPKYDSAILQWIDSNGWLNSKDQPFEWRTHAFLIDPMSDWSKQITIRKSAQIGFSESFGILKSIYGALKYDLDIIYTLPSDRFAETFVNTKFNPILEKNAGFGNVVDGSLSLKKIGRRFIHFMGTHNVKARGREADTDKGISITSDLNVHDERDRSDQNTIEQYASRLENSDYGGVWSFSNPTYPGVGTDDLYELSDQKKWFVVCEECGLEQYLDWIKVGEDIVDQDEKHCLVDVEKREFVCVNCMAIIPDRARLQGRWIAKYPEREISGYWMSQLNYVKHSAHSLLTKEGKATKQHFCNFILGKAYRGTDETVDRRAIARNIIPEPNSKQRVAMGVDQGIWKHYVIGNEQGIFEVGKTKQWEVIEQLIRKYNALTVIDALPYENMPKTLVKKYPGKVFMCFYSRDKDEMSSYEFMKGPKRGVVRVQRTKYFDILVDKFTQGEKPINLQAKDIEEYIEHWETLSRQEVEDAKGVIRGEWVSSSGKDHYAHATLYQDVAMTRLGYKDASVQDIDKLDSSKRPTISVDDLGLVALPSIEELVSQQVEIDWRYQ